MHFDTASEQVLNMYACTHVLLLCQSDTRHICLTAFQKSKGITVCIAVNKPYFLQYILRGYGVSEKGFGKRDILKCYSRKHAVVNTPTT
jgi:hypothetical protein